MENIPTPPSGRRSDLREYGMMVEPSDTFPIAVFDRATESLLPYSVSFAVDKRPSGSGTLVTIGQKYGVLTAAHVVTDILQPEAREVTIIFMNQSHRFRVGKDFLVPRSIGPVDEGPDLAFVEILDATKLGTLKGKKSFIPLSPHYSGAYDFLEPKISTVCCLFGTPAEFDIVEENNAAAPWFITRTFFAARAQVVSSFSRGEFDYMKMGVIAGSDGFPRRYAGMSGGGVWHIPLFKSETGEYSYQHPELIGVAFWESDFTERGCTITCHGPQSLKKVGVDWI